MLGGVEVWENDALVRRFVEEIHALQGEERYSQDEELRLDALCAQGLNAAVETCSDLHAGFLPAFRGVDHEVSWLLEGAGALAWVAYLA